MDWKRFIVDNINLAQKIELPPRITEDEDFWTDVIYYGWAESAGHTSLEDPITTAFHVRSLDTEKYQALVSMIKAYFKAGFPYIEPYALKKHDRLNLRKQFDPDCTYIKKYGDRSGDQ